MPVAHADVFRLYYAANKLGMQQYVSYFPRGYKEGVRSRTPSPDECEVLEQLAGGPNGAFIDDAAARLAYLRRTRQLSADEKVGFAEFLKGSTNMRLAVEAADARVKGGRK